VARGEHAAQTGRPAAAKLHGRSRPQPLQTARGSWQQFTQTSGCPPRARSAIEAVFPQIPHRRQPRAWRRQVSHSARPASSCHATGLTFPQPAGSAKVTEPRAISSMTSRPIAGGAPCASARESAASAADTSRSACGLVITASMAAATTVTGKDPSAAATWAAT